MNSRVSGTLGTVCTSTVASTPAAVSSGRKIIRAERATNGIELGTGHPVVVMPGRCPEMVMSIDDRGADTLAHVLLRDFAAGITLNRGGSFQFSISKRTTL